MNGRATMYSNPCVFVLVTTRPHNTSFLSQTNLVNIPPSYMSPSPSPDELIIQQRGRRKVVYNFFVVYLMSLIDVCSHRSNILYILYKQSTKTID